MSQHDQNCTVLFAGASGEKDGATVSQDDILKGLESSKVQEKISAAKNAILALLSGEKMSKVLMYVIRFCSTHENNQLKKHLMIYWEVVPKYDSINISTRKLLPEMILVCNALLNDLNSPNEFIRGCMLRFLCKIKEPEILEPLKDAIKANLSHRHSYVRRNAVMTVFMMYKHFGDLLIPDAPELIQHFLSTESDSNARRNAFLMLFETSEDKAVTFLMNSMAQVAKYGDGFSLVILELTRKVCLRDPAQKSRFVACVFSLLNAGSPAVSYEAAWTLITLSNAPTAVRAAAKTYSLLLSSTTNDNNLKLIVLDRLSDLKKYHAKVLQESLMDMMRVLSSPSLIVCEKVLAIAMDLLSSRNIDEVIVVLKREVLKTQESAVSMEFATEYRHLLIRAIHKCAVKFPSVAGQVVPMLMDFLTTDGAMDVIVFVRAMCESYPELRPMILSKLLIHLRDIKNPRVCRVATWILGEYAETHETISGVLEGILEAVGDLPLTALPLLKSHTMATPTASIVTKSKILADGTYASEVGIELPEEKSLIDASVGELRRMLVSGNFFLAASLSAAVTKLGLKLLACDDTNTSEYTDDHGTSTLILSVMQLMVSFHAYALDSGLEMDADSQHRIDLGLKILATTVGQKSVGAALSHDSRHAFTALMNAQRMRDTAAMLVLTPQSQCDELISFRQLRGRKALGSTDIDIDDGADIHRAVGGLASHRSESAAREFSGTLPKVHPLSGFDDPVYAEAVVTVLDYDIVLDILVINRTASTLNALTIELSTIGDLKVVERPEVHTIGPFDTRAIRANIKVSSTETGHIFGTMVYDSSSGNDKTYINLNDIHLDIMDYIQPAECTDVAFRTMWAEFEWENKVAVNTDIRSIVSFCHFIISETHMRCLSPLPDNTDMDDDTSDNTQASFLAANLYAKSIFGEDALANLSVEKRERDGKIVGYIRIRSKTQGIALSLGDRITAVQRGINTI